MPPPIATGEISPRPRRTIAGDGLHLRAIRGGFVYVAIRNRPVFQGDRRLECLDGQDTPFVERV